MIQIVVEKVKGRWLLDLENRVRSLTVLFALSILQLSDYLTILRIKQFMIQQKNGIIENENHY